MNVSFFQELLTTVAEQGRSLLPKTLFGGGETDDIEALAEACRFGDCAHNAEPGCAVQAALALGQLDERRLASYKKLKG